MVVNQSFFRITRNLSTPCIVYDLNQLVQNYHIVQKSFPKATIHYAMKANANPRIIQSLIELGSGFEVASFGETELLLNKHVPSDRIICMHTIKSPDFLQYLQKNQIHIMAVDSYEEVDKIARYVPDAKLVVRVAVDNVGSGWPLTGKFGIEVTELPTLFQYILSKHLTPYGTTFHVGSQCFDEANWLKALYICHDVWEQAADANIRLSLLSLGGGLAVKYNKPVPDIANIGTIVTAEIIRNFVSYNSLRVSIEPGRAIVANAGILITEIVGTAKRDTNEWAYIQTGTYNGLIEAIETSDRQLYPLVVEHTDRTYKKYKIGGPTCVSLDTPFENVSLPEVRLGERLYILNCGAYCANCSTPFNGFPVPREYFSDEIGGNTHETTDKQTSHA